MKKAVFCINIGDAWKRITDITIPTIKKYASKIGADYIELTDREVAKATGKELAIVFEKLFIYDLLVKYDRVILLDIDLIVLQDCPDLFEIVPERKFGATFMKGGSLKQHQYHIRKAQDRLGEIGWRDKYFNSGVMVVSKCHREVFNYNRPLAWAALAEQNTLNWRVFHDKVPGHDLGHRFNLHWRDKRKGKAGEYIVHYAGKSKDLNAKYHRIKSDVEKIYKGRV